MTKSLMAQCMAMALVASLVMYPALAAAQDQQTSLFADTFVVFLLALCNNARSKRQLEFERARRDGAAARPTGGARYADA